MIPVTRGMALERADGQLTISIHVSASNAAAALRWLASCPIGTALVVGTAEQTAPAVPVSVPSAPAVPAQQLPATPKPPPQQIGMDSGGIDGMVTGNAQIPPEDQALILWARALTATAPFQSYVEAIAKRDPIVDGQDHARDWLVTVCGIRNPAELPKARDKLRQIAAEYRHWYQHSHPPGGDAFASVPKCKLVDA